jgi:hypothetical protein
MAELLGEAFKSDKTHLFDATPAKIVPSVRVGDLITLTMKGYVKTSTRDKNVLVGLGDRDLWIDLKAPDVEVEVIPARDPDLYEDGSHYLDSNRQLWKFSSSAFSGDGGWHEWVSGEGWHATAISMNIQAYPMEKITF